VSLIYRRNWRKRGLLRLDAADFLVGGAGTASAITFEAEGEVGKV
jgi:hypothetical protein